MLLITLTFTDLSFAHEFYCAIKKRSMKCWLHFSGQAFVLFGGTCMNRNIFSLHNHNSFFFLFFLASNNKRGWREKLLKSRVWYESRKNSRTTHENTPQTFFSFQFVFSLSISIKRIVDCSWEKKRNENNRSVERREQRMMSRERRN